MAKTTKPEKKTPQRAAAGGKGKTPNAAEKAAKTLAKAVVGASVTDDQIDKFWSRHVRLSADLVEANKGPSGVRKKITALMKELAAVGVDKDGFKLARRVADLGEGGSAVIGWYQRLAKRKNLPGSAMQLDLLDPAKNAATLVDADKVVAATGNGANGHANGSPRYNDDDRPAVLKDVEEIGFQDGIKAKDMKPPRGIANDEGKVAAYKAGYARGQKKNMAGITAKKPVSRGALKGRFN